MSILEELKNKIADIETQSLAMDGCRPTFTVSEIMDLIDSVESAQNLRNACTDTIYRQAAIDLVNFECGEWTGLAKTIGNRINELPSAQPDEKLRKIADLVEGSIDHFDRDDAMDLLYQIKEIVGNETSNIRG